jgi:uncharacterized membrane protein
MPCETAVAPWEKIVRNWRDRPLLDRLSWLFLVLAAALSLVLVPVLASNQQETFSEFYIDLTEFQDSPPWREALAPGEPITLIIGVANREHADVQYHIELVDPSGTEQVAAFALVHEETWEQSYTFTITQPGDDQKVEFLLYKDGDPEPYRSLHFWLTVRENRPDP